jgi:hypothetical protein
MLFAVATHWLDATGARYELLAVRDGVLTNSANERQSRTLETFDDCCTSSSPARSCFRGREYDRVQDITTVCHSMPAPDEATNGERGRTPGMRWSRVLVTSAGAQPRCWCLQAPRHNFIKARAAGAHVPFPSSQSS